MRRCRRAALSRAPDRERTLARARGARRRGFARKHRIDDAVEPLHRAMPGMVRQHALASRGRQASARPDVVYQAEDCGGIFVRRRCDEQVLARHGVHARGGDATRDDRHAHRHRLEDLVLRAARDIERRDHHRGAADVRPHVGNGAGHGDSGERRQLPDGGRRVGADDRKLHARTLRLQPRQRARAEFQHAFLVRVVVHPSDECDRIRVVRLVSRREEIAVDAVRKPVRRAPGPVILERLPFGPRRRRAQVERAREPFLFRDQLDPFQPVAEAQRKPLVVRVFEPFLRVHVAEVENLRDVAHVLYVVRHRRAMHEHEVERLRRQQLAHRAREACRMEVAERRRLRRRQARDHPRGLHRTVDDRHLVARAERRDPFPFLRFRGRARERGNGHLMRRVQVADHVERPDLAAALRRKREAVADVEDPHAAATLISSTTSSGARPSR